MNFKMWPFAQYINFNFIPPELQLLYMNCVALVWTITLTSMMN
jgi:protein Mpv17